MSNNAKYVCASCEAHLFGDQLLEAPNPFDLDDTITGCPECKAVSDTWLACDEDGCWRRADCGTPSQSGYRQVCGNHFRKLQCSALSDGSHQ